MKKLHYILVLSITIFTIVTAKAKTIPLDSVALGNRNSTEVTIGNEEDEELEEEFYCDTTEDSEFGRQESKESFRVHII